MKKRRDNLICTFCYRRRPRRFMKHDVHCRDALCEDQHWMCRSEHDCMDAMRRRQ